eukprot:3993090-Prymnesium_polylepis.1
MPPPGPGAAGPHSHIAMRCAPRPGSGGWRSFGVWKYEICLSEKKAEIFMKFSEASENGHVCMKYH